MNIEKMAREWADKLGLATETQEKLLIEAFNAILEEAAKEIMGNCVCDCDLSEGHECVLEHAAEVIRKLKCS